MMAAWIVVLAAGLVTVAVARWAHERGYRAGYADAERDRCIRTPEARS